ncbi:MAG TPA: endonuclease/exonuclease/phosphatase family protein [Sphingobacterium sp.]|nr:endonuclease/exonuclease/phosphatase family protein [Sphingobacterium sp.]
MKNTIDKYIIFIALSFLCVTANAQKTVKILSYNVLYGLKQDSANIELYKSFVRDIDPDIVATQEMNDWTQETLEKLAESYGHPYALQSKEEGFPVALTSKKPLVNFRKVTENMWHSYIYAKVEGIHVFVIHFSPFDYKKRVKEVENVLAQAQSLPNNEPIVIMGDFNSLAESDDGHYGEEMLQGMVKTEETRDHVRNLNNGYFDYSVLNTLKEAGFSDSYKLLTDEFESSLPTHKDGDGKINKETKVIPRRIDFLWSNPTASEYITKSEIIKNDKTNIISDHYPVYVELTLPEK